MPRFSLATKLWQKDIFVPAEPLCDVKFMEPILLLALSCRNIHYDQYPLSALYNNVLFFSWLHHNTPQSCCYYACIMRTAGDCCHTADHHHHHHHTNNGSKGRLNSHLGYIWHHENLSMFVHQHEHTALSSLWMILTKFSPTFSDVQLVSILVCYGCFWLRIGDRLTMVIGSWPHPVIDSGTFTSKALVNYGIIQNWN